MSDEMNTLELQIEAKAKGANASLTGLVKRLGKVSDALTKVQALTAGFDKITNIDFGEIEAYRTELREFTKELKNIGNKPVKPRVDRSDLKYTYKTLDEIKEKFKDVGKGLDFSGLGQTELDTKIKQTEKKISGLKDRLQEKLDTENVDTYGKAYVNLVYKIQKAENELKALKQVSTPFDPTSLKNMKIQRGDTGKNTVNPVASETTSTSSANVQKIAESAKVASEEVRKLGQELNNVSTSENVSKPASGFEELKSEIIRTKEAIATLGNIPSQVKEIPGKIKEIFGNLKAKIQESSGVKMQPPDSSEIETTLKRIQSEIAITKEAIRQAFSAGDLAGVEELSAGLKELEKSQRAYTRLKESVYGAAQSGNAVTRAFQAIGSIGSKANNLAKGFDKVQKSVANARKMASKAIHPFRTLKELMGGVSSGGNGMGLGRMIGSSILFSTIFGAISQIKQAVKEGSDNLVQYSDTYNKSISGMVSSLLYLKNAWAAAFAPIINVVAPYVSAFIDMMARALNSVGQFMAALTGKGFVVQAKKAWKDYGASIADTSKNASKGLNNTNDAAKKLKKTIFGFDELNVLTSNDDTGSNGGSGSGSGSGGGYTGPSPSDMFETIKVPDSMKDLADKFKEALAKSDFTDIGRMISDKLSNALESIQWNKVYLHAENFGKDIATFLNGLITPRLFYDLGKTLANSINTALHSANAFAINFDWKNLGTSLAKSLKGFIENWDAKLTAQTFSNLVKGIINGITAFVNTLRSDEVFATVAKKIVDLICNVDWLGLGWDLLGLFTALARATLEMPVQIIKGIAEGIAENIFGVKSVEELKKKAWDYVLKGAAALNDKFTEWYDAAGNLISGFFKGIGDAVKNIKEWIKEYVVDPFIKGFKALFGINSPSTVMAEIGQWILPGFLNGVKEKVTDVINWFGSLPGKIKDALGNAKDWLVEKGKGAIEGIKNGWEAVKDSNFLQNARKLKDEAFTAVGDVAGKVKQKGIDLVSGIKSGYENSKQSGLLSKVENLKNEAFSAVGDVANKVRSKGSDLISGIRNGYENSKQSGLLSKVSNLKNEVFSYVGNVADRVKSKGSDIVSGIKSGYENNKWSIRSAVSGIPNLISSGIGSLYNIGQSAIASFANGFASIHIPMPHIGWNWNRFDLGNFSFSVPSFNLRWYAKGGFPNMGEMFIAGEKGPEMVGQIGKKNAVANNTQITTAIKEAVVEGMMQVAMATSTEQSDDLPYIIHVEVKTQDNEVLAQAVEKGKASRDSRMNPSPAF